VLLKNGSDEATQSRVCRLETSSRNRGCAPLVRGRQVAIFRLGREGLCADNRDPSRRGERALARHRRRSQGELVVASPVYKQHFSLVSAARRGCGGPDTGLPCQGRGGFVFVEIAEVPTTCLLLRDRIAESCVGFRATPSLRERRPGPPRQLRPAVHQGPVVAQADPSFGDCSRRYTAKERPWEQRTPEFLAGGAGGGGGGGGRGGGGGGGGGEQRT